MSVKTPSKASTFRHERTPPRAPTPYSSTSGTQYQTTSTCKRGLKKRLQTLQQDEPPIKTIYLIRHGESLAQRVKNEQRKRDKALLDCGLTNLGKEQAIALPDILGQEIYPAIELVICSPLTRAIHTAILGFPDKRILIHYDLRELGSDGIPENTPRRVQDVRRDLCLDTARVDFDTNRPPNWPLKHDISPRVIRRDRIKQVFEWIAQSRPEKCIAVVCHFHVIQSALRNPYDASPKIPTPQNAVPIVCELTASGRLSWSLDAPATPDCASGFKTTIESIRTMECSSIVLTSSHRIPDNCCVNEDYLESTKRKIFASEDNE